MAALSLPRIVWPLEAELGEGPVWADGALWFVDIKKQAIHRLRGEERKSWAAPQQIGFLHPAEGRGGFVVGLAGGLHHFSPESGAFSLLAAVEPELPGNRLNDGAVDPSGRLWFGTMDDGETAATGRFYSFTRGALRESGLPPVAITNGPALSPDGRILYWVDTLAQSIHACDISDDGLLGAPRLFARLGEKEGFPDGPAVDSEGCVWIALYWGWSVRRYSPSGELLETVRFPVSNITKIAFGGEDLRTVYATTARQGIRPDGFAKQPDAGALFAFDVDVPGLAANRVKL